MKILIQRVKSASVTIDNQLYSSINKGILAFVGIEKGDTIEQVQKAAKKITGLRIFADWGKYSSAGNDSTGLEECKKDKMNRSLIDVNGEMLIVSQFTLCGDCKKGTRPSFDKSAEPEIANELYEKFITEVQTYGIKTAHGKFGAMMDVELINDGPVTFILEF